MLLLITTQEITVSTHSRSKAAACEASGFEPAVAVSTHSRSKAAAPLPALASTSYSGFNSQPLEGGCPGHYANRGNRASVSTHSRSKAAALVLQMAYQTFLVSTHSRSKAAAH